MIYLASPFFNPEQVTVVEKIEFLLDGIGLDYFSPRRHGRGNLSQMEPEERKRTAHLVFRDNVDNIIACNTVIAVIDGRDPGVMWEIGCAYSLRLGRAAGGVVDNWKPRIVTYTDHDYGVNVMIQECVDAHCRGTERLRECLVSNEFSAFRDFVAEKVT
jgi:nucleoside 2-deoxyribosyltransferase